MRSGIALICILVFAGLAQGDLISTMITSAGSAMIHTAVTGPDEEGYSSWLFSSDRSVLSRDVAVDDGIRSTVQMAGTGPMALDEQVFQVRGIGEGMGDGCVFEGEVPFSDGSDSIRISGMMQAGRFASERIIGNRSTESYVSMNGTGQVRTTAVHAGENESTTGSAYAAGDLNLTEMVVFEAEEI